MNLRWPYVVDGTLKSNNERTCGVLRYCREVACVYCEAVCGTIGLP